MRRTLPPPPPGTDSVSVNRVEWTASSRQLRVEASSSNSSATLKAYAFDGLNSDGTVKIKELGTCETYNCGRGAKRTQMNLRVSRGFHLVGNARVEAIGEIFNLFNAKNPAGFTTTRLLGTGAVNTDFLRPQNYAGDFQQPEQRVGQIGFRFSF